MFQKPKTILGINPGARYLGFTLFRGTELRDWGVRVTKGEWSKEKAEKIKRIVLSLIEQHEPVALAIKKLHPSRSSPELNRLVAELKDLSESKGLRVYEYPLKYLEAVLSPGKRINKGKLAGLMAAMYPDLFLELGKESSNRNRYYTRMFEAAALAHVCLSALDRRHNNSP